MATFGETAREAFLAGAQVAAGLLGFLGTIFLALLVFWIVVIAVIWAGDRVRMSRHMRQL